MAERNPTSIETIRRVAEPPTRERIDEIACVVACCIDDVAEFSGCGEIGDAPPTLDHQDHAIAELVLGIEARDVAWEDLDARHREGAAEVSRLETKVVRLRTLLRAARDTEIWPQELIDDVNEALRDA